MYVMNGRGGDQFGTSGRFVCFFALSKLFVCVRKGIRLTFDDSAVVDMVRDVFSFLQSSLVNGAEVERQRLGLVLSHKWTTQLRSVNVSTCRVNCPCDWREFYPGGHRQPLTKMFGHASMVWERFRSLVFLFFVWGLCARSQKDVVGYERLRLLCTRQLWMGRCLAPERLCRIFCRWERRRRLRVFGIVCEVFFVEGRTESDCVVYAGFQRERGLVKLGQAPSLRFPNPSATLKIVNDTGMNGNLLA